VESEDTATALVLFVIPTKVGIHVVFAFAQNQQQKWIPPYSNLTGQARQRNKRY